MNCPVNIREYKHLFWILALVLLLSASVDADEDRYALLIQSSPPDGGTVTPGTGVHKMQIGQTVTLAAKPKPGYRFMYWLGDVSATSGLDTTVSIDSPKLVVAVFSKDDFDEELPGETGIFDGQPSFGGGGRYINPVGSPGAANPASGSYDRPSYFFNRRRSPEPEDDDIPVPDGDDIPVPGDNEVPEPATMFLLALGGILALKRNK